MSVEFSHWRRVAKKSWSPRAVEFLDCEISVEVLTIEHGKLIFSGTFDCPSNGLDRGASGCFSVTGRELGVSKVD